MSSFDVLERSVESSRPIEIYSIAIGPITHRYTSAEDDITVGLNTFEAIPISRNEIKGDSGHTVTITVPPDEPFAAQYANVPPSQKATVSIIRLQRDESPTFATQRLIWKGEVVSVSFPNDGEAAQIATVSLISAMQRNIPRIAYMASCNHVLYGPGCNVDPAAFTNVGTVTAVSGNTLTVSGLSVRPDQFFRAGFIKPTTEQDFRLILDHVGNDLVILLPFATNLLGAEVQVFAGCNHRFDGDCASKFDNVSEFGGFPYVPRKSIFETGIS